MKFPFFKGGGEAAPEADWRALPPSGIGAETRPEHYEADPELADAVNVALLMNKPLLLTGDPGTGKTQLAYRLAWELNIFPPLKFETKSASVARDLFYIYDALGRFHDAQCQTPEDAARYITYNALGRAVLLAAPRDQYKACLPPGFTHDGPRRSVVLIDEIDKAPRDFPNDILNEIEQMYFRIPELGNAEIAADRALCPVVVITSNSERHLPDPFLRRCVYHHIRFPEPDRMRRIVETRLRAILTARKGDADMSDAFLSDAVALFYALRDQCQLSKKPSTAELILWLAAIRGMSGADNPIAEDRETAVRAMGALVKTGDMERAREFMREWRQDR